MKTTLSKLFPHETDFKPVSRGRGRPSKPFKRVRFPVQKTRKPFMVGEVPANVNSISTWSSEQIRLAGAWARRDIQHRTDPLCQPYDWVPAWIGELDADQVYEMVMDYYAAT